MRLPNQRYLARLKRIDRLSIRHFAVVFLPAVKLPEVQIAGAEVVVDDVHQYTDAALMRGTNKFFQRARTAVIGFHGK